MGIYLNPNNRAFSKMVNSDIYVDHSLLLEFTNKIYDKDNNMLCVSRPRRFGKSTDANMLTAYYSKGCDSEEIFNRLQIGQTSDYRHHLNQYNVIYVDMQDFLSKTHNIEKMILLLGALIYRELKKVYPDVDYFDTTNLVQVFDDIYVETNDTFIFVVDEWDCIFRDKNLNMSDQEKYLDFLRNLWKGKEYVSLVYMTGILPIKKYGTHSALNMFDEISMVNPGLIPEFMGFTGQEVRSLCLAYGIDFEQMQRWYDGYHLTDYISTFSPRSVVASINQREFGNYWTATETYEALRIYIDMNFYGLKDDVIRLLAGESVEVDTTLFQNDMTTFESKDDVLTLLIHLGYLGYDKREKICYIPNKEIADSFASSIKKSGWNETTKAIVNSKELLKGRYKAVFSDIDGTLLDTSHCIPEQTKKRIGELGKKGIPFVLVSARMPKGMTGIRDELGFQNPMVCYSGALVVDGDQYPLYSVFLPQERVCRIVNVIKETFHTIRINVYSNDHWYVEDLEDPWIAEEMFITGIRAEECRLDDPRVYEEVHKILCMGEKEQILKLEKTLMEQFPDIRIYRSKDTYLEIMSMEASKSDAIQKLEGYFGINREEILAFGDSHNDIDMLQYAGLGVAMENADPVVRESADMITESNDREGLRKVLDAVF